MIGPINRNNDGFTLIEIIAVLLLMSIIAATVLGRSINTAQTDLTSQMDKVRTHFRYIHSMAMKYGDQVWGIRCSNVLGQNLYWGFRLNIPVGNPLLDPDDSVNMVRFPGETQDWVNLTQNGVAMTPFTIFFDRYGRPYTSYIDVITNTPLPNPWPPIDIWSLASDPPPPGSFVVTAETGLIQ
ncbi:MAG: prepilin-type N-terminal cleavage/methylation domain-containing protein [Desulfobacterales bacterium]|jgi:prepilin-type N-terminal cleavage/methylation domain-containing protein